MSAAVNGTVYLVDDDAGLRQALQNLLASFGMYVVPFASATEYVASTTPDLPVPSCLLLDVKLPDISGFELQRRLAAQMHPPIVFITGHGDIPSTVRAMKAGAVDFLPKPFVPEELLPAIESAFQRHQATCDAHAELISLRARYAMLTPREREVLSLVVSGFLNKQSAAQLGIREVTLQIHRRYAMRKMRASSLAELVRMASKLGIATVPTIVAN